MDYYIVPRIWTKQYNIWENRRRVAKFLKAMMVGGNERIYTHMMVRINTINERL